MLVKHLKLLPIVSGLFLVAVSGTAKSEEKMDSNLERIVGSAINACSYGLRYVDGGKNVAESVSMSDYLKFNSNYEKAVTQRPDIASHSGKAFGKVVKDTLPKCIKIMDDYASGVGAKDLPVSKNCIKNVSVRLKPILPGGAYHSRLSAVWFARKDLESARYRMYRDENGLKSGGATCDANDQFKNAFKELADQFLQAEEQVKIWEQKRGVEFHKIEDGSKVIFKKEGKILSSNESNRL